MPRPLPRASGPLAGAVIVPGDKSVSHRAALFALLADGPCRARGWLVSADTLASLDAVAALGAAVVRDGTTIGVDAAGAPAAALRDGDRPVTIDCRNSGTTARLLCGLLAGWLPPGGPGVVLDGDASLRRRPMDRVVVPLLAMGARIAWLGEVGRLPLHVRGAALQGRTHALPVPSAQLKSALLLAGLHADGSTSIDGGGGSRDHTERLLAAMGAAPRPGPGDRLTVAARRGLLPYDLDVPGDPSTAAFFQVAAALVPGSRLRVPGQSLGHGRTGALDVLRAAGAEVRVTAAAADDPAREPMGDVTVAAGTLRAFRIGEAEVPGLVDELPVLAVLATQCAGTTVIDGAAELRVKESDRIALMARGLRALGADVAERPDGLVITGPTPLRGGPSGRPVVHETGGDHRIAMALAVAALVAAGESALDDPGCVAVSFPEFFPTLAALLAD
ncbi:MAG: 3-phosphoshikimate 1-carboxyvinyltransferase [Candidatus Krumholzibacteriia bacterium]